jgi:transposase
MSPLTPLTLSPAAQSTSRSPAEWETLVGQLTDEVTQLRRQIAWFQRQIFGQKSERRVLAAEGVQGTLGESFEVIPEARPEPKKTRVESHERQHSPKTPTPAGDESPLFFDEQKVPVEVIHVPNAEAEGLSPDAYEVIGEKVSHRLAQRPGSYVVLKYVRPLIKRRDTQTLSCPPAPVGVIEGSRADVSFIAGMMVDKFAYHLPLYRLHQRLRDAGFKVSRHWLTQLMQQAVALLEPINEAQFASIRAGRISAMDETPIKAGPTGTGKMKAAYFWPVYGQHDEICFLYYPSRSARHVQEALGLEPPHGAVLLTDGYAAYAQYARKTGLTHAQCWTHTRRKIFEASDIDPQRAGQALDMIGALYAIEARIRDEGLTAAAKQSVRLAEAKPVVEQFFRWVDKQFEAQGLLPSHPLLKALAYARERREGLMVYLDDPDVPIDTNHLERALRVIPMGRKNWLFAWTELGAKQVGIVQSLLVTCRLHDIDPYDYFVDVLQRVGTHPARDIEQLTPRRWKTLFAAQPLRSDLHGKTASFNHAGA